MKGEGSLQHLNVASGVKTPPFYRNKPEKIDEASGAPVYVGRYHIHGSRV